MVYRTLSVLPLTQSQLDERDEHGASSVSHLILVGRAISLLDLILEHHSSAMSPSYPSFAAVCMIEIMIEVHRNLGWKLLSARRTGDFKPRSYVAVISKKPIRYLLRPREKWKIT